MSGEQAIRDSGTSVAVAKTTSTSKAREDSVSSLETNDYVCVEPSTPLFQAIEIMKRDEGGCAIVCGKDRAVVGIITERDLLTKIVGDNVDGNTPVSAYMTPDVATLAPEATIGEAVTVMNEKGYRNIPLVTDGKLVGSVSVFDIIRYLAESYPQATMNLPPNPHQVMDSEEGG